jgi:two-component system OmpR family response regulator
MRLLLVEDHPTLAEALAEALERSGFAVDHAADAAGARRFFGATDYDLVVLDIGLPDGSGLSLLAEWRRKPGPPVLLLTARDRLDDRVEGLDAGADDYIVKPVEVPELIARCRAVLRRPGERTGPCLSVGPLELNTATRNVELHGERLALSRREVAVLEQLMLGGGRVVPRERLEQTIYGFGDEVGPNALEAAVSRLRRALRASTGDVQVITVRGVGWMLAPSADLVQAS